MKTACTLLFLALFLSSCATMAPASAVNVNTVSTDAMCSAVFIMLADYEDAKDGRDERTLAYYDTMSYMIAWEQEQNNVSIVLFNNFVAHYKENMDSPTWLLHWRRCVVRANEIYPHYKRWSKAQE